ncbi:MAG: hypothetical protein DCC71_16370 [Proteobacteria bacterium]|nr:MAG: hypothetical protein DCC71_16370 [Pseudomonadota bacterium]
MTPAARAVPPVLLAIERAGVRVRLTWAFHAREIRFERAVDDGFEPLFPETFSFHLESHDPAELHLQLEDLWSDPRRLGAGVTRRDAQELMRRLVAAAPRYVENVLDQLDREGRLAGAASVRVHADVVVLARALARFVREKQLEAHPETRYTRFHLRKLVWRASWALVRDRVGRERLEAWLAAGAKGARRDTSGLTERALLEALASGSDDEAAPLVLALAERSFHRWLEDTCLDAANECFDSEDSPFASREEEVLAVTSVDPAGRLRRPAHLSPFLRRSGSRDCLRILQALGAFFLRQYDVPRAAALIRQEENLQRGRANVAGVLSWHSSGAYGIAIAALVAPFAGAALAYERAPLVFDVAASLTMMGVLGAVLWYLIVRFLWQKDLAFFHSAVPRIGAGIIVGYLPVFLIDEVWDLARRPWFPLGVMAALMGTTTLLYLYVEVKSRIRDPREAFSRARRIFLLGVLQAEALGLTVTSLLGGFMVVRTWSENGALTLAQLREAMPPFVGELPRIMGIEPFYVYPTAVLLMTFLSLFIGTFLQLLWEDLPITEPL